MALAASKMSSPSINALRQTSHGLKAERTTDCFAMHNSFYVTNRQASMILIFDFAICASLDLENLLQNASYIKGHMNEQ
jgi:hypothetical protein